MVRDWKFWIYKVNELYYPCRENKRADQRGNSAPLFSHVQFVGFLMMRLIYIIEVCVAN